MIGFRCPGLHTVVLNNVEGLTDEAFLKLLERCPLLTSITLRDNLLLTAKTVANITETCSDLERFEFGPLPNKLTDTDLIPFFQKFSLTHIALFSCRNRVTEETIAYVNSESLQSLIITNARSVSDYVICRVIEFCTKLTALNVSGCPLMTENIFTELAYRTDNTIASLDITRCPLLTVDICAEFMKTDTYCLSALRDFKHNTSVLFEESDDEPDFEDDEEEEQSGSDEE
eukprot:gene27086-33761_t